MTAKLLLILVALFSTDLLHAQVTTKTNTVKLVGLDGGTITLTPPSGTGEYDLTLPTLSDDASFVLTSSSTGQEISGGLKLDGDTLDLTNVSILINGQAGQVGQVLRVNSSGTLEWADVSSSPLASFTIFDNIYYKDSVFIDDPELFYPVNTFVFEKESETSDVEVIFASQVDAGAFTDGDGNLRIRIAIDGAVGPAIGNVEAVVGPHGATGYAFIKARFTGLPSGIYDINLMVRVIGGWNAFPVVDPNNEGGTFFIREIE